MAAGDGPVGRVETPIFSGTSLEPHSLLLRTVDAIPGTFAAVASNRVASVDEAARSITLDGTRDELFGGDGYPGYGPENGAHESGATGA